MCKKCSPPLSNQNHWIFDSLFFDRRHKILAQKFLLFKLSYFYITFNSLGYNKGVRSNSVMFDKNWTNLSYIYVFTIMGWFSVTAVVGQHK